jgi:uncharacterized membrane-anchored protein
MRRRPPPGRTTICCRACRTPWSSATPRAQQRLQPLEARDWVRPPRYNLETHQITWAALILPKTAPLGTGGEITFNAIGFGRHGYIHLSMIASLQEAEETGRVLDAFLAGLNFNAGAAYGDVQPGDKRAPDGLAGALGMDSLHKARTISFWKSDLVIPVAGGFVGAVGALSLLIYIQRYRRKASRRW